MNSKRAHQPLALQPEGIERELTGLPPQEDGELSHLDQHLADDAENLQEEELDAGIAERLGDFRRRERSSPAGPRRYPINGAS